MKTPPTTNTAMEQQKSMKEDASPISKNGDFPGISRNRHVASQFFASKKNRRYVTSNCPFWVQIFLRRIRGFPLYSIYIQFLFYCPKNHWTLQTGGVWPCILMVLLDLQTTSFEILWCLGWWDFVHQINPGLIQSGKKRDSYKVGPLPVITGFITPITRVIRTVI